MICAMCNGDIELKTDTFSFESKTIGQILIPNVEFEECQSCGDKTLAPEVSAYIINFVKELEAEALNNIPASDLITAGEAAKILDMTKQGFSKNKRIKRGFIYYTKIGTKKVYSRRSTELYKETKDGRFKLPTPQRPVQNFYIVSSPPVTENAVYDVTAEYQDTNGGNHYLVNTKTPPPEVYSS